MHGFTALDATVVVLKAEPAGLGIWFGYAVFIAVFVTVLWLGDHGK